MLVTVMAMLLLAACASTGSPVSSRGPAPQVRSSTTIALTAAQAALIRDYYSARPDASRGRGNGRGRNGGLPPGIARNLERGKALPPGIARQTLPASLLVQLPSAPGGLEYLVVAGKLVLVEAATQVVRQVLLEAVFS